MTGVAWVMTGGMSVNIASFVGDARTWVGMERVGCVSGAPEEGDEHGGDGLHGVKPVESICVRISLTTISGIWSPGGP